MVDSLQLISDSTDYEVQYDDPSHRYFYEGRTYLSATQLLDRFKDKFDTEAQAQRMSDSYGQTPEYWKKKWKNDCEVSIIRGNEIHNSREDYLYGRGVDTIDGRHLQVRNKAIIPVRSYIDLPDGVYPELKLWSHEHRIAGRADKIILRTVRGIIPMILEGLQPNRNMAAVRIADVEDYKTNKKIYRRGWQEKDGTRRMMLSVLSHLEDCEFNHYALQLSIYQYILELKGFHPGKRRIIHYQHEIEGVGTPKPVIIEVPYLRDEVIAMIKHTAV